MDNKNLDEKLHSLLNKTDSIPPDWRYFNLYKHFKFVKTTFKISLFIVLLLSMFFSFQTYKVGIEKGAKKPILFTSPTKFSSRTMIFELLAGSMEFSFVTNTFFLNKSFLSLSTSKEVTVVTPLLTAHLTGKVDFDVFKNVLMQLHSGKAKISLKHKSSSHSSPLNITKPCILVVTDSSIEIKKYNPVNLRANY